MFGNFATRDEDFSAFKPFQENRRCGGRRRSRPMSADPNSDRRARRERRLDCDWRYAVIRRLMGSAFNSFLHV